MHGQSNSREHRILLEQESPAQTETGLTVSVRLIRQPGCPGSSSIGPVALRPHLSMGLPFRSRSLLVVQLARA
jgi:hypothetical protein